MRSVTRCMVNAAAALAVSAFLAGTPLGAAPSNCACHGKGGTVSTNVTLDVPLSNTHDPRIFGPHWKAQTFKMTACGTPDQITFSVRKWGSPPQNLVVGIYNVNETTGAPEIPIGMGGPGGGQCAQNGGCSASPLAEGDLPPSALPDDTGGVCRGGGKPSAANCYQDEQVTLTSSVALACNKLYAAVWHQKNGGGDGNNSYQLGLASETPDTYPDGRFWRNAGASWIPRVGSGNPETNWDVRMSLHFTCAGCPGGGTGDCGNTVGSLCCALTQGAYGAWNSQATALGNNDCCTPMGMGAVPLAACQSNNVFAGDPNQTTIGIHLTQAVTIGPSGGGTPSSLNLSSCVTPGTVIPIGGTFSGDLATLNAYLPSTGTPAAFNDSLVGTDTHYSAAAQIPDLGTSGETSGGQGGGTLAGQAMTTSLNNFMSTVAGLFSASGFGGFTVPGPIGGPAPLFCTKRAGSDKTLGTSDDVCEAFQYPACAAGRTVSAVLAEANNWLVYGTGLGFCTNAGDLNNTLDNFNRQFDSCGVVIACAAKDPLGGAPIPVTTAGVFTCP